LKDYIEPNRIVFKKAGTYAVTITSFVVADSSYANSSFYLVGGVYNSDDVWRKSMAETLVTSGGKYLNATLSGVITVNENDYLKFMLRVSTAITVGINARFEFALVEQIVPDIIANKGALVNNPVPSGVSLDAETGKMWANTKPDYSNERATPVINFSGIGEFNQSWVADENGWVRFSTEATNAAGNAWLAQMAVVNSRTIHYLMTFPNGAGWGVPMFGMVPVSKGNTFTLYHNGAGFDSIVSKAYFIPDRIYAP
jgi:hypothetical protein